MLIILISCFLGAVLSTIKQRTFAKDALKLKAVNYSGVSFYVGPIHYDWVLNREKHVLENLYRSLSEGKQMKANTCTMIDVGTNDGFYSNMAGAMGCQVWGFEIQRRCMEIAFAALSANKLHSHVSIYHIPVSNTNNDILMLPHSTSACDGLYSLGRADCPQCPKRDEAHHYEKHRFHTVTLDAFVPRGQIINFIKIDTEGHDPEVLEGSEQLFKNHQILNAMVESQPKMWSPQKYSPNTIFEKILEYGYEISCASHKFTDWPTNKFTKDNKEEFIKLLHTNRCVDWLYQWKG